MLKKSFAILMACLLLPVAALAETDAERIADLEARVQALEEAVAALQGNAEAEPEERTEPVELEDAFPAAQGVEASAVSWDFLSRFSYYPSGSYFSRTLSASNGYVLVGVAAFTAAVVLTVVCMRLHEREKQKRKHEEDAT